MLNFGCFGVNESYNFINFWTKLFEVILRLAKLMGNIHIYMLHKNTYIYIYKRKNNRCVWVLADDIEKNMRCENLYMRYENLYMRYGNLYMLSRKLDMHGIKACLYVRSQQLEMVFLDIIFETRDSVFRLHASKIQVYASKISVYALKKT